MEDLDLLIRYSVIMEKNPREIVLLRGSGCKWRRCSFCDYHLDFGSDPAEKFFFNSTVLENVTGEYKRLEVINSGSFSDLDENTLDLIQTICMSKNIHTLYFECHWHDREHIAPIKKRFSLFGIEVQIKGGVETFDKAYREAVFIKGIDEDSPEVMAKYYDQVCLLFGIYGQTELSMKKDMETALRYFKRVCVNIMTENSTHIKPDAQVIKLFKEKIYPIYKDNPQVDILIENTAFGVGEKI